MDIRRVVMLVMLGGAGLLDILMAAALTQVGALAAALKNPTEPRAMIVLGMIAAGFAAPPIALSLWKRQALAGAFIVICTPLIIMTIAQRFGI